MGLISRVSSRTYRTLKMILLYVKRKTGKDYFANLVASKFTTMKLGRISQPLKSEFARKHNLDVNKLLGDGPYKEKYRKQMVDWGEKIRGEYPSYFCEKLPDDVNFVTDCRRISDVEYFKAKLKGKVILLKIVADENTRNARGWIFTKGIDDMETECGLDTLEPDFVIVNNNESDDNLL